MNEICTLSQPAPQEGWSPAAIALALQRAADEHAKRLCIDFDRMRRDFSCLWMIVRSSLFLERPPQGDLSIKTWLRRPSAAVSVRDFTISDASGNVGSAVQLWALVDERSRHLVDLRRIEPLWSLPAPQPERTELPAHLKLPTLPPVGQWRVDASEIDRNGHLNNVAYLLHAQEFAPADCRKMTAFFDRECFLGERLTLEAENGCVRIVKPDGSESFRCRFETAYNP